MNIKLATALRSSRATQIKNALDADTNPGFIEFYTAPQPTTGGAAITTQTKIATCTLSKPSGTVSNGVLTFAAIANDLAADASGDIAWARFKDGAGNWVLDGDCGASGSGAMVIFNTVTAIMGGLVEVLSGSITEGNA
ncbi:MAG: hypothetical protein ACXV8Q_03430 [Methylobacter sp.]